MTRDEHTVSQEQLWAPWRLDYIVKSNQTADEGCFLCRYRDQPNDAENLVVERRARTLVVLNRYPYNNGHLLVAPEDHRATFDALDDETLCQCVRTIKRMTALLTEVMKPDGFNIGLNLGKAAGAGLPGHLHWHIVPRWNGDTNFMPVLGNVNVIPQSLAALYRLMRDAIAAEDS